jgi:hypothetical protein
MGSPRGKAKKTMEAASNDDKGSGRDDAAAATTPKRRGRPQKPPPSKDGADEVEDTAKSEENGADARIKPVVRPDNKDPMMSSSAEAGLKKKKKRRRRRHKLKRNSDEESAEEGELHRVKSKPNGFRQIGSRRKSTPRRAAEAGVN